MRREVADAVGSGLLLAALLTATFAVISESASASHSTEPVTATVASVSPDAGPGASLFYAKGCVGCHSKEGMQQSIDIGPNLTGLAGRAGERRAGMDAVAYVRESIKTPSAFIVPGYERPTELGMPELGLRDDEIDALVAFLLRTP